MRILDPLNRFGRLGLLGAALGLTLALGACGGEAPAADDAAAPDSAAVEEGAADEAAVEEAVEEEAAADEALASGSVVGTVSGDLIVIDRSEMADMPCHAMDNTIMGNCNDDDIDNILATMGVDPEAVIVHDMQTMMEAECHVMERTIMGSCSDEDVTRLADEIRAGG